MASLDLEAPAFEGEPSSLTSLKLERRPSDPLRCSLLFLRLGNLTPFLDLPMAPKELWLFIGVDVSDDSWLEVV